MWILFLSTALFAEDKAVIVNSSPSGAKIYLNAEDTKKTTPSRFASIKASDRFVLKKEGFNDCEITKIDKKVVSCELKPPEGE